MPDYVSFNDPEGSWLLYQQLKTFSDGMGGWKFLPEDAHLLDQPEAVMNDVLKWEYLTAIMEKQERKRKEEERDANSDR